MRYQTSADALDLHDERSAERQLWCAVLDRALDDALDRVGGVSAINERDRLRHEAREWFSLNGYEFRAACESAGFDPDYLRPRIMAMIAELR